MSEKTNSYKPLTGPVNFDSAFEDEINRHTANFVPQGFDSKHVLREDNNAHNPNVTPPMSKEQINDMFAFFDAAVLEEQHPGIAAVPEAAPLLRPRKEKTSILSRNVLSKVLGKRS